ncbi:hypothetical protein VN97_g5963 [Penicillium thymicola]|uniref:Uncharacterized protein n=1 Tax=Penicillium thymicola TaxID=293382 RepID=A0AAI9THW2_PENTH|nr:hypothetical protein VN97_g5963 [Penicillium thymicola]
MFVGSSHRYWTVCRLDCLFASLGGFIPLFPIDLLRSQEKRGSNATALEVLTAEEGRKKKRERRLCSWQSCQTGSGDTDPNKIECIVILPLLFSSLSSNHKDVSHHRSCSKPYARGRYMVIIIHSELVTNHSDPTGRHLGL